MKTGISEVTTVMKVNKEVNGFRVYGTVEVYNEKKEIKSINVIIGDPNTADNSAPMVGKSYSYTLNRGVGNSMGGYDESEEAKSQALTTGLAFEKIMQELISTSSINELTIE